MTRIANVSAAVLVCAFSLIAQQHTLVVDSGQCPYTQITQAIAAAQPGDRIEVHASLFQYATFALSLGSRHRCRRWHHGRNGSSSRTFPSQAVRIHGFGVTGVTTYLDHTPRL